MTATTKQTKRGRPPQKRKEIVDRRTLHRVGTVVHDTALDKPKSVGQRMAVRRLALGMTQEEVANKVTFRPKTGKREGAETVLSRNAYCMYETDGVEPDLSKIIAIAKVLKVAPQWLALGIGEPKTVKAFAFSATKKELAPVGDWLLSEEWLDDHFGLAPESICLFILPDYALTFAPGEIAIVQRDTEPTGTGGEFVFVYQKTVQVAHLTRPHRTETLRVFSPDLKSHEEIPMGKIQILGRVIGKIGNIERSVERSS